MALKRVVRRVSDESAERNRLKAVDCEHEIHFVPLATEPSFSLIIFFFLLGLGG